MSERRPQLNEDPIIFDILEDMRNWSDLAEYYPERSETLLEIVQAIGFVANKFVAVGKVLQVNTIDPSSTAAFEMRVDDTYEDEGCVWWPTPGIGAYEDRVIRRANGQAVFTGHLYKYTPRLMSTVLNPNKPPRNGPTFEIHDFRTQAVVVLSDDFEVNLVEETDEEFAERRLPQGMKVAGRLGFAVPSPEEKAEADRLRAQRHRDSEIQ